MAKLGFETMVLLGVELIVEMFLLGFQFGLFQVQLGDDLLYRAFLLLMLMNFFIAIIGVPEQLGLLSDQNLGFLGPNLFIWEGMDRDLSADLQKYCLGD